MTAVAFSPDGKLLASSADKVAVWDIAKGNLLGDFRIDADWEGAGFPVFLPDGKLAFCSDIHQIEIANVRTWGMRHIRVYQTEKLAVSPDGRLVVVGTLERLAVWDALAETWTASRSLDCSFPSSLAFSPTGKLLASGMGACPEEGQSLLVWDVATLTQVRSVAPGPAVALCAVAFSPDGQLLASGSTDEIVRVWDVSTWTLLKAYPGHTGGVTSVAFSPGRGILASASSDKTIKLWDLASGELVRTLTGHAGPVNSVAFSPDGRILASGSDDKTIKLWDVSSCVAVPAQSTDRGWLFSVALGQYGLRFPYGFWNTEKGE